MLKVGAQQNDVYTRRLVFYIMRGGGGGLISHGTINTSNVSFKVKTRLVLGVSLVPWKEWLD